MTDRLGEALARWNLGLENNDDEAVVLAAARSWHTLTEGRALIIERDERGEWPIKLRGLLGSWAHRWPDLPANSVLDTLYDTIAVDALTVTPTPEADGPNTSNH